MLLESELPGSAKSKSGRLESFLRLHLPHTQKNLQQFGAVQDQLLCSGFEVEAQMVEYGDALPIRAKDSPVC